MGDNFCASIFDWKFCRKYVLKK